MGTTVDQMLIEMGKAKEIGADVVEIRLDCLRTFNPRPDLELLIKRSSLPTLVTYRFDLESQIIIISHIVYIVKILVK